MGKPLWKAVCRFLIKLKIEIPYNPVTPLLGIYRKKTIFISKRYMHLYVYHCIIYNSQNMEATNVSIVDEWIKKRWYIYTMEYYLAKKERIPAI